MFRAYPAVFLTLLLASALPVRSERGGVTLGWLVAPAPDPAAATAPPVTGAALLPVSGAALTRGAGGQDRTDAAAMRLSLGAAFDAEVLRYRRSRPLPERPDDAAAFRALGISGLRDLIASVESGRAGYDAIHHAATRLPAKRPSRMTIAEIRQWIADTPGQHHAIGRYQVVPKTLRMLTARLNVPETAVYSPALQDRFADALLADAGLAEFLAGTLDRDRFMTNVATIWAGLPAPDGRSVYHGIAGNRAGMSWADYRDRLAEVFPR
ncbi:hypothetical protein [Frigidibacter sp. ROC022]|uniref:hypothetical protein n=1 Tax=Frigidibacter sp. ROC022 TaxID=2971796 RepID=UPI00215AA7DA|nr:hypothetical protein [Frigidibacter sp. ROC022]MCR8722811.1 hypothetical protein [Frigidibacter sp. ROC022]